MLGVRAFADATQAIQCGNPERSGEVAIGAAAHGRLLQNPA